MTIDTPPTDLMASGPLLTRQEAADALNVSKATVYRLVRSGELPAFRVGHQIRIGQTAVENYLLALPPPVEPEDY